MKFASYNSYNFRRQFTVVIITSLTLCCAYASTWSGSCQSHTQNLESGDSNKGVCIHWTGLLDWTTGLDYWTGLLDWTTGLDDWSDL